MSDFMETGGFGKNPAIDKINQINTAKSRISAVAAMEKKIFQPSQPKQKAVLDRRKQIQQEFQIRFQKGRKKSTSMEGWFCRGISRTNRRKNIWGC